MFEDFDSFLSAMKGRRAAVLGLGVSNTPLMELLVSAGALVMACDKNEAVKDTPLYLDWAKKGVRFSLGEGYLDHLDCCDIVFKSPGIRFDLPQLAAARSKGIPVTSEMEVFFDVCKNPIIGVTGSDGKTTTTTLIAKLLEASGHTVRLGGNIGTPLLSQVGSFDEKEIVVLELSSFQLHTLRKSPHTAVVTNVSPNHLDMHKSMEEYVDAKKNIFRYQSKEDTVILNFDNEITRKFAEDAPGHAVFFSRRKGLGDGYFVKDGVICRAQGERIQGILKLSEIKIPGMHNVENYMAAIAATEGLVTREAIVETARSFGGVEHRIELVRELGGVKYYNSSIDSSPARSSATLAVFPKKVIMIAGGKDKNIPYDDLGGVILDHVKALLLIGATADKIEEAVRKEQRRRDGDEELPIYRLSSYPSLVKKAQELAESGDVVVLSPASTSFDMFKNFEERGRLFKRLVMEL